VPIRSHVALRTPSPEAFTLRERRIIESHRTPLGVQRWLRALPYNRERRGPTLRTFRGAMQRGRAHCLEAVLVAATVLDQHGWPPLVLDIESQDGLDHVLLLYRVDGRWGTVARSRDAGLHGRRPVYRSIRDLVESYFDPYVDGTGRITGYGTANLDELVRVDWRLAEHDVRAVERALIRMPHRRIVMPEARYRWWLRRYERLKARTGRAPTVRNMRAWYGAQTRPWL
jgi:hypothetical protein